MPSEKLFWKIIRNGPDKAALYLFKMTGQALSTPIALLSFRLSISRYRASNAIIAFPSSLQLVQVLLANRGRPFSRVKNRLKISIETYSYFSWSRQIFTGIRCVRSNSVIRQLFTSDVGI